MAEAVTKFTLTYHDDPRAGRLAVMTMDNGADHRKPTTLGGAALESLSAALDELEGQADLKGVLLTGKPFIFAAGADLTEFTGVDAAFAERAGRRGHEVFGRLAALPVPTLAAINGVMIGGGIELALHCDYRTISSAANPIAFSEVFLSIVPAWGGTQLATRLLGAEQALQLIVHNPLANNRMMRAEEVAARGLADRLVPAVDLLEDSVALLGRLVTGEEVIERPAPSEDRLDEVLAAARQAADDRVHGATPAPYRAIDLIEFAAREGDLAEGREREIAALAELLPSRQAQASVYSFDLVQRRVKRQPGRPDVPARPLSKVGVLGAGLMGAQLGALMLARLEAPLVMRDIDEGVLAQARATIEGELDKRVERGRLSAAKAGFLKSIVTYTTDLAPLAGSDVVIEAVVEVLEVKQRLFAEVEEVVDAGTILASNTSSLSIAAMAADLAHPERVVGLHFFNPVAVLPLVEVIKAPATNDTTLSTAFEVAKQLRKSAVRCEDAAGFVVNRVLFRWMNELGRAANDGTPFVDVDDAVKALGLPMGPYELLGLVGLKVAAHVARTMHEAFPERFGLDPNVVLLGEVDVGGIYDWSQGKVPFPEIAEAWRVDPEGRPWTAEEIQRASLEAVADEVKVMLDEGVVADARDVDTCMLLGAGWPFFNGGICYLLDAAGVSERLFGAPLIGREDRGLAS